MSRSARVMCVALALSSPALAACGDDDGEPAATETTTSTTAGEAASEIPTSFDELAAIFGPALEAHGLALTRAAVVQLEAGPHVALYGVPAAGADTPADYLDRLLRTAVAAGELAFGFDGIVSFDLCQEPVGTTDESPEPVTVVLLTRSQWDSVPDWSAADLVDLLVASERGEAGEVQVPDDIEQLDEWQAAAEAAGI